jgi:septal ring factor EnvC (AmiA/AmiB activator)
MYTNNRTIEDYKKLLEEQAKATKILAKRCRDKEKEIEKLYKEMARLRGIIKNKKTVS